MRQPEQLGLGHAIACAERALGNHLFAVLLADDFLTYEGAGVTADLARSFKASGKTQLSVMELNGPEISKYGVVVPNRKPGSVAGLLEKPNAEDAPSNLARIGRDYPATSVENFCTAVLRNGLRMPSSIFLKGSASMDRLPNLNSVSIKLNFMVQLKKSLRI
mgnify:FL=1